MEKAKGIAGAILQRLFAPTIAYEPSANFRDEARAPLGGAAAKLIKAVNGKGSTKVAYGTRQKAEAA